MDLKTSLLPGIPKRQQFITRGIQADKLYLHKFMRLACHSTDIAFPECEEAHGKLSFHHRYSVLPRLAFKDS